MPITLRCKSCSQDYNVIPSRAETSTFCSYACAGQWRRNAFSGEGNPRWTGGQREKTCQGCGSVMNWTHGIPASTWKARKFCTKSCADKYGFRYSGKDHPNYREDARRKNRGDGHAQWAQAVISRDKATCQHCGAVGVELHAHHIKSYRDHPELRLDVSNGLTLCHACHWRVHATASNANAVNSGNTLTGKAEGNPEPSSQGNLLEGVTTRGRAYRRWCGPCKQCGEFISKPLSDISGKNVFCSKSCSAKYNAAARLAGRWKR